jgi:hypothetical protein
MTTLLDPTAERSPVNRPRRAPPKSLDGVTVALLDIGKARGDVFLDKLESLLADRGIKAKRYRKPTNTRTAPTPLAQQIAAECGVVVEALSD